MDTDYYNWTNVPYDTISLSDNRLITRNHGTFDVLIRRYDSDELALDYIRPLIGFSRLYPIPVNVQDVHYILYERLLPSLTYQFSFDLSRYRSLLSSKVREKGYQRMMFEVLQTCDPRRVQLVIPLVEDLLETVLPIKQRVSSGWFNIGPKEEIPESPSMVPSPETNPYYELVLSRNRLKELSDKVKANRIIALRKWASILGISPFDVSWIRIKGSQDASSRFMRERVKLPEINKLERLLRYTSASRCDAILESLNKDSNLYGVRRYKIYNECFIYCVSMLRIIASPSLNDERITPKWHEGNAATRIEGAIDKDAWIGRQGRFRKVRDGQLMEVQAYLLEPSLLEYLEELNECEDDMPYLNTYIQDLKRRQSNLHT